MNDFERKQVWELLHKAERAGNSAEALGYNTEAICRLLFAVINELEGLRKDMAKAA